MEGASMSKLRFPVKINNGELSFHDRQEFINAIKSIEGDYYLELKEVGARSPQQNNYYWSIAELLGNELGYTKREMHELLKVQFGIDSTKNLEVAEFAKFIEEIIRWSAIEFSIAIPDPKTLL
jgi:hypothetical protein